MKARIGFVLFILAFLMMAIVVPLIERVPRLVQNVLQPFSSMGEQLVWGTRIVINKITAVEWKNFTQKA